MNLSDITKINFGSAGISAVYNGGIKLWPTGTGADNKVMKFTTTNGKTWDNTHISAYTADNRLISPVLKDATGWTYDEEVGYLTSDFGSSANLLTFEGFPNAVKIKSGDSIFRGNTKCTNIATNNIDFSECTKILRMFGECSSLTTIDVSHFNTSQVTNLRFLFGGCKGLTSLDVSHFDTSQVTDMGSLFFYCSSLSSLDLSNFNTTKVTDMSSMFYECSNLTSLDLSNWDTSKVSDTTNMFHNCSALKTVEMANTAQKTRDKIGAALDAAGLISTEITVNGVPV